MAKDKCCKKCKEEIGQYVSVEGYCIHCASRMIKEHKDRSIDNDNLRRLMREVNVCQTLTFHYCGDHIRTYPELLCSNHRGVADGSNDFEAKEEIKILRDALKYFIEMKLVIDDATVPRGGIEVFPEQVVYNASIGYLRIKRVREALRMGKQPEPVKEEEPIPTTVEEAMGALDTILTEGGQWHRVEKISEETFLTDHHHDLGRWIRNEWGLWSGGPLKTWFETRGIHHADDMSGIIFTNYYRQRHNEPIKLEEQIAEYIQYWKDIRAKE